MLAVKGHILFIAPSAYPLGGVATWLDYIVPGLRERDWKVTLGLVEGKFHDVDAYLDVHPDKQGLRIPYGTGTPEGRVRRLAQAIRDVRPDIAATVNIADVAPAVERIRATSEWSPRVATTLHGVQADFVASIAGCAAILDAVICTNRLVCELVARSTAVDRTRIHYAPYGVDMHNVFASKPRDFDGLLRIAYVGRLEHSQKRIEDVSAVVAELDRRGAAYELVIAGGGPDESWLRGQLSNAVASGRVRFLGTLSGPALADQVYRRSHALLITSLWETGPIVAWEAMANGAVVVTSAHIGSGLEGSLVPGENCLMFPIGDAVAAADCLERLRDGGLRDRLRRAGAALVASRYSTAASIEQWNSCFGEIVARPPLPFAPRAPQARRALPAGRLDRVLGRQMGETIRELLGFRYDHAEAGGEWPHANVASPADEAAFWQLAKSLDRGPAGHITGPSDAPTARSSVAERS